MNILAIETSTLTGSVAITSETQVIGELTLSVSVRHSERLMPAIDRLFSDAGMKIADIDLFAVAKGPGSFTGLRIGMAAAQGLASAAKKPVIGISTLEGLAVNGLYFSGLIVPVLNAFRGEVYRGIFRSEGNTLIRLQEDAVMSMEALKKELESVEKPILLLGDGTEAAIPFKIPRASNLAFLALKKWDEKACEEPLLPVYLRQPG